MSKCTVSSLSSHLVCFGPTEPFSGLVYDMFLAISFASGDDGDQSDTWISSSKVSGAWKGA